MATAPTTAAAAGNEFLALGRQDGLPIDQMKLQKLLFYAHAWHLATKDAPLFDEDIEAWPWGPVVRTVYSDTASYGRSPVDGTLTTINKVGPGVLDFRISIPPAPNAETKAFIKSVWDSHKSYTGVQLSNATHAPGEPWSVVKDQYGSLDKKPVIPNDLIAAIFKAKLNGNTVTA